MFTIHIFKLDWEIWMELYSWHYVDDSLFVLVIFA